MRLSLSPFPLPFSPSPAALLSSPPFFLHHPTLKNKEQQATECKKATMNKIVKKTPSFSPLSLYMCKKNQAIERNIKKNIKKPRIKHLLFVSFPGALTFFQ